MVRATRPVLTEREVEVEDSQGHRMGSEPVFSLLNSLQSLRPGLGTLPDVAAAVCPDEVMP